MSRRIAIDTNRRRAKRSPRAVLAGLSLLAVLASGVAAAGWYELTRSEHAIAPGAPVEVVIESGSSTESIAQTLSQAGVIPNALMFRLKARLAEADGELKAGTYSLVTGTDYDVVLRELSKGPRIVIFEVPIPEGFTAKQIAARFAKRADVSADELLALLTKGAPRFVDEYPFLKGAYGDSLEGYLFPATYQVKQGVTAEEIVRLLLDTFVAKTANIDMSYAESKNLTFSDVIVIASMIEREARLEKERPLVASVIYNRLKAKMRLQICATVLYRLPEGTTSLTLEDLKLDSPYNTYIHAGLPPGPISNPGLSSIQAAAKPPKTKYLYYVLTGKDGSHTYVTNYADFLKAKRVSQRVFGN